MRDYRKSLTNNLISRLLLLDCKNISDMFVLIKIAMEFCESYNELKGFEKEDLVIIGMKHIIDEKINDSNMKLMFLTMIKPSIDMAISVSKNKSVIHILHKINTPSLTLF